MNSQTLSSRADLEFAEAALREVLISEFKQEAKARSISPEQLEATEITAKAGCTASRNGAVVEVLLP